LVFSRRFGFGILKTRRLVHYSTIYSTSSATSIQQTLVSGITDNLYISDTMNHRVRKVEVATGLITTVAGNGDSGYEDKNMGGCGAARFVAKESAGTVKHGDGLLGVEAVVNSPVGLSLDSQGYLYICERGENKIRRVKLW